jgi:hypothetical protein
MQYYRLSESIIQRIIRAPKRVEKGVAENTVACMIPKKSKKSEKISHFLLYVDTDGIKNGKKTKLCWLHFAKRPVPTSANLAKLKKPFKCLVKKLDAAKTSEDVSIAWGWFEEGA